MVGQREDCIVRRCATWPRKRPGDAEQDLSRPKLREAASCSLVGPMCIAWPAGSRCRPLKIRRDNRGDICDDASRHRIPIYKLDLERPKAGEVLVEIMGPASATRAPKRSTGSTHRENLPVDPRP